MVKCQSCQEVIEDKFKAAIANNICPICGAEIYNRMEFAFRKRVTEILQHYDLVDMEKINAIVNDICSITNNGGLKTQATTTFKQGSSLDGIAWGKDTPEETVTEADISNNVNNDTPKAETEEEKVVREMIESGEITMVNKPSEKKIPLGKIKKPPMSINRIPS